MTTSLENFRAVHDALLNTQYENLRLYVHLIGKEEDYDGHAFRPHGSEGEEPLSWYEKPTWKYMYDPRKKLVPGLDWIPRPRKMSSAEREKFQGLNADDNLMCLPKHKREVVEMKVSALYS